MKKNKFDIFRESFAKELELQGDAWRVFRPITLIDLIKLSFIYFQKDNKETHLIDIFNNSMKVKLLSRINAIETDGKSQDYFERFNKENDLILREYDSIIEVISSQVNNYSSSTTYDLNEKISYLKVINDLRIDSYTEDVFNDVICIVFNLL